MLNPIPLGIAQPARELQTAGEFKEIVLTQIRKKFALAIAAFRQGHDLQAFDTLTSLLPEVTTLSGAETVSGRDTSLEAPALSAQIQTYLGLMLWRTQPDRAHEE